MRVDGRRLQLNTVADLDARAGEQMAELVPVIAFRVAGGVSTR
jgi:hypothetical protein